MCMMSFYDLIQGEGSVSNCRASYWSVLFTLVSHMAMFILNDLIGLIRSYDLIPLPCSFQLHCLHRVVLFFADRIILDLKLFLLNVKDMYLLFS